MEIPIGPGVTWNLHGRRNGNVAGTGNNLSGMEILLCLKFSIELFLHAGFLFHVWNLFILSIRSLDGSYM